MMRGGLAFDSVRNIASKAELRGVAEADSCSDYRWPTILSCLTKEQRMSRHLLQAISR